VIVRSRLCLGLIRKILGLWRIGYRFSKPTCDGFASRVNCLDVASANFLLKYRVRDRERLLRPRDEEADKPVIGQQN
jgi:hypothetical protein